MALKEAGGPAFAAPGEDQSGHVFCCLRQAEPEVKITLEHSLLGNLSVEDWQAMKEVLSAVGVSQKMLTQTLHHTEHDGLITNYDVTTGHSPR